MLRSRLIQLFKSFLPVLLLASMPAAVDSTAADSTDSAEIERIRQRANDYFTAVSSRRFRAGQAVHLSRLQGRFRSPRDRPRPP